MCVNNNTECAAMPEPFDTASPRLTASTTNRPSPCYRHWMSPITAVVMS